MGLPVHGLWVRGAPEVCPGRRWGFDRRPVRACFVSVDQISNGARGMKLQSKSLSSVPFIRIELMI